MLYVITPVFNRKEFTRNYLQALAKQTVKDFKVLIVDDGSTDGSSEMIETEFPNVILLKEKGDLWWAEATNIGVRYAIENNASYVMTLNDDTVPEPDYIEKMLYWSERKPLALLGALAINILNNEAVFGGEILNWKLVKYENILAVTPKDKQYGLKEVNIFPGRGLLIPKKVFDDIGLYDSRNFPQTVADLDFTARASNAGFEIFCNYDAKIKTYIEESGNVKLQRDRSWQNYYQHLFGIRGGGNLKWFVIFTIKNAPKKFMFQHLLIGSAKRIVGYLYTWTKEVVNDRK